VQTAAKVNLKQIRSSDLDNIQKFNGTTVSKHTSLVKFLLRYGNTLEQYEPNCGEMTHLTMLKTPSKNSHIYIMSQKKSTPQCCCHIFSKT